MKNKLTILAALMLAAATGYSALLSVDFESDTVGSEPGGTIGLISDANNNASGEVVDSTVNKAGTGNGWRLIDDGTADYFRMGYEFSATGETAVRVDMDIARLTAGTSGTVFDIGLFDTDGLSGSHHDRYVQVRVSDTGDITATSTKTNEMVLNESHTLTIYANDGDTAINDYSGTRDLAADSADFWLDGVYWGSAALRDKNGTDPLNTTSALAAVGFISTSASEGLDYAVDNISVEVIPEPATVGMFGVFGAALLLIRRRLSK